MILNLAVNARDAMPDGGHLDIATANVPVEGAPPLPAMAAGDWVRLTLRDSGTGMTPEVKAHLFEPFFTTKAEGRGTGLGLATVYGIVKQSGGHIHVESDVATGSAFEIYLPRGPDAVLPGASRIEPRAARFSGSVLLVEDDAGVREVAARALREGGFLVLAAGGAGEAMELAARSPGPVDVPRDRRGDAGREREGPRRGAAQAAPRPPRALRLAATPTTSSAGTACSSPASSSFRSPSPRGPGGAGGPPS